MQKAVPDAADLHARYGEHEICQKLISIQDSNYKIFTMNTPSYKFKKMICAHDRDERNRILGILKDWLLTQTSIDPNASACYNSIQEAYMVNQNLASNGKNQKENNKAFKDHYLWGMMPNHDRCVSFQEIVKAKGVPMKNIAIAIRDSTAEPRKAIPKKVRGEAWKNQFGDSTKGECYCCTKALDIFDDWHAGHIVSHSVGGADTAANLRPVCGSCNLSMGTENMDAFKARCYPSETNI